MEQRYLTQEQRDDAYKTYRQRGIRVRKVGLFSLELRPHHGSVKHRPHYARSPVWQMMTTSSS